MLPVLFWFGLYVGFSSTRRVGLSRIAGESVRTGKAAYFSYLYSLLILFLLVFGILVSFSVLWPIDFGQEVDPFNTPPGTKMPWYLLAPYGLIEFLPQWIPLTVRSSILLLLLLLFLFFPFLEPSPELSAERRKGILIFGWVVFSLWIFFSVYGLLLDVPGA